MSKSDKKLGKPHVSVLRMLERHKLRVHKRAPHRAFGFSVERSDFWGGLKGEWAWSGKRWYQWYATEAARDQAAERFKRKPAYVTDGQPRLYSYRDLRFESR
jgi:hypothetical protein